MLLIKKPLFYDSLAMYANRKEYTHLLKADRGQTFVITLVAASLFLIPLIGVFIYVLQLLFFANYNLQRLAMDREGVSYTR